jgi:thiamine-phosphate pyrophosphorylase
MSLREKDLSAQERMTLLRELVVIGHSYGATVTVHGDIKAAQVTGADGVHLPSGGDIIAAQASLGRTALIGISAHSLREIQNNITANARYATLSPVFASTSKPRYGPTLGLSVLAAATDLPIIALGGIDHTVAAACREAGAAGIAVMGAMMRIDNPVSAMCQLVAAWMGTNK